MARSILKLTARANEKLAFEIVSESGNEYIANLIDKQIDKNHESVWRCTCFAHRFTPRFVGGVESRPFPIDRKPCKHLNDLFRHLSQYETQKVYVTVRETAGIYDFTLKLNSANLNILYDTLSALESNNKAG